MGMFDYIQVELDMLPTTDVPPPSNVFQTKDTPDQYMTTYTITRDGRLTWRPYVMQEVPKAERPYPNDEGLLGLLGCMRRVEGDEETVDLHGDVFFYTSGGTTTGGVSAGWWEYRARFTEGRLSKIILEDFEPPEWAEQTGTGT